MYQPQTGREENRAHVEVLHEDGQPDTRAAKHETPVFWLYAVNLSLTDHLRRFIQYLLTKYILRCDFYDVSGKVLFLCVALAQIVVTVAVHKTWPGFHGGKSLWPGW